MGSIPQRCQGRRVRLTVPAACSGSEQEKPSRPDLVAGRASCCELRPGPSRMMPYSITCCTPTAREPTSRGTSAYRAYLIDPVVASHDGRQRSVERAPAVSPSRFARTARWGLPVHEGACSRPELHHRSGAVSGSSPAHRVEVPVSNKRVYSRRAWANRSTRSALAGAAAAPAVRYDVQLITVGPPLMHQCRRAVLTYPPPRCGTDRRSRPDGVHLGRTLAAARASGSTRLGDDTPRTRSKRHSNRDAADRDQGGQYLEQFVQLGVDRLPVLLRDEGELVAALSGHGRLAELGSQTLANRPEDLVT